MPTQEANISQFLLLRSSNKDQAVKFLMDRYGDTMYGIITRIVKDTTLADDAFQEGFIKVWKNIDDYNEQRSSLFTWLFTIIKNAAIDLMRRESRRKIQSLDSGVYDNMAYSVESNISDVGLMQKLKQLEPKYQELIELIYLKSYTQQEVADALNMPLGTVKTRIQAAIKILREKLITIILMIMMFFK